ncbi:MAG: UDP-N-acetylmuramoyl-tripeptide--D-alanyl-D-alanine ligase [Fusobacteria bacterium]|nr:UDP-N-acetylmuramoyl-tripeptide--D-alanyl-D-alanine ligase [Fusobacteriota bacterium]
MGTNEIISRFFKKNYNININNSNKFKIKTSSKEIQQGDVFIAIRTGNNYIEEAFLKGASLVVYDGKNIAIEKTLKNKTLYVNDSIQFLQKIAKYYRENLNTKIIGITGSNGKTTTKDILYYILKTKYKVKKTIGNLNNHIGVPITILDLETDDEVLVLEMGMSGYGEISLLSEIANIDYGIITNIGDSHILYLKNRENVFKAKSEILPYIKENLVINGDDPFLKQLNGKKIGIYNKENIYAENIKMDNNTMNFDLYIENIKYSATTNLIGEHNLYNIMVAIAMALEFEIDIYSILEAIKNLEISNMRYEKIQKENILYINDAYNASPISMKYAINTFSNIYNDKYKIMILGDMLELGEDSKKMHESVLDNINDINCNEVYLFGEEMKYLYNKHKLNKKIYFFSKKEEISDKLNNINKEVVVLLKGSRGMKLEEIIELGGK